MLLCFQTKWLHTERDVHGTVGRATVHDLALYTVFPRLIQLIVQIRNVDTGECLASACNAERERERERDYGDVFPQFQWCGVL